MKDIEELEKKYREHNSLALISLCFILASLLYTSCLAFYPFRVAEVYNYTIMENTTYQGGVVRYTMDYCKYMNVPGVALRSFTNDLVYAMPAQETNVPVGCGKAMGTIQIPNELPPGKYHIVRILSYQVNPLQKVVVVSESNNFTVLCHENS